jgi:hypothetical protein
VRIVAFALVALALAGAARAQDAPEPRQIAPDRFAPSYRDTPPPRPRPPAVVPAPVPPPTPVVAEPPRTPIVTPDDDHPLGACDHAARDFMLCLGGTSRLSEIAVIQAEGRVVDGLDHRPNLSPLMRAAVGRAFHAANDEWRQLRDRECGELTLIEHDLSGPVFEQRLVCRLRRDLERIDTLDERYGQAP